ncbi:MAG: RNA polymerase sigma factor [Candidatus Paceibacterota bacterium]|jgi:RNA polymerase sigma-70 factor (ECF subfamily)
MIRTRKEKLESFEQTVAKAGRLDEDSFALIYQQCVSPLYRFFYIRVKNKAISEDLTQLVFLKAWGNIKDLDNIENITAWLFTVARNTLIDHWRKKKDISVGDLSFLEEKGGSSDSSGEIDIIKSMGEIELVLDKLNDEQREVVTLKFFDGRSNKEIEKIMRKSSTSIRSLQYRAMLNLRDILNKDNKNE